MRQRAVFLAALVAAGCSTDEPSVIIALVSEGDPPLGMTLDSLRLTSTRLGSGSIESRLTEVPARYEGSRLVPMTTRLTPEREDDPGRTLYRIRAEGVLDGRVVVAAQHRVAFVAGRTVPLALRFEGACVDVACADDLTCASGGCVDDFIPSCVLLGDDDPSCARDSGAGPGPNDLGLDAAADGGRAPDAAEAGPDDLGPNEDIGVLVDAGDGGPDDAGPDVGPGDMGPDDMGPAPIDSGRPDAGPMDAGPCPGGCGVNEVCSASGCTCEPGFQSCDGRPGCESSTATDPLHCGNCATACTAVAPSCIDGVCVMCTAASDCDDGLGCTTDSCAAGTCVHTLIASRCLIDGVCRTSGASNGPCQTCDPARSTTAWSNDADGTSCNDSQFCTLDDACMGGACTGTGSPCGDNITYRCVPQCNEATDTCTANFGGANTHCYIDFRCVHESWDDIHPTNQCLGCEPSIDNFDYSPRQTTGGAGEGCDDGLFCTATDLCTLTATPACVGSGARCDDGLSCTTDTCNEGPNSCTNTVAAGVCAIDGVCYAEGTFNPANECQRCTSATSQTSWSNRPNSVVCGGGFASCCSGTCHPCSDTDCACTACTGGAICAEGVAGRCFCS